MLTFEVRSSSLESSREEVQRNRDVKVDRVEGQRAGRGASIERFWREFELF